MAKIPLQILASRLSELLIATSDGAIEEAIDALQIEIDWLTPLGNHREALSLALLRTPLRDSLRALEVLAEYLEGSRIDQIIRIMAHLGWICARPHGLWTALHVGRGKPTAVLNGSTAFCARMYVDEPVASNGA